MNIETKSLFTPTLYAATGGAFARIDEGRERLDYGQPVAMRGSEPTIAQPVSKLVARKLPPYPLPERPKTRAVLAVCPAQVIVACILCWPPVVAE